VAVDLEQPNAVLPLLDAGADVNTLSQGAWETVEERHISWQRKATHTLLDIVSEKMKELERYKMEKTHATEVRKHSYLWVKQVLSLFPEIMLTPE